jgi:murein DD-endopeptidase MepM/ murein hydrolase activator NlpD
VRVVRRLAPFLAFLLLAAPAVADQTQPSALDARIAQARGRETALAEEIGTLTSSIRSLEASAGDVTLRLTSLEEDLALHRNRLARINSLLAVQTEQIRFLKREYRIATGRLSERLVHIYEEGQPSTLEIVLGASSLKDALDRVDYMSSVADQDARIVEEVARGRIRVRTARVRTAKLRQSVAASTRVVAYRAEQARALRDQLLSRKRSLAGIRDTRERALADTRATRTDWVAQADALRDASAAVATEITASQPAGTPPSSAGLIWPVSGPINSPFGMRWGTLHPGLDIGAGMGTPIRAAASGRVVVSGYSGGYGNLIVIDHGNGLATAYAHQSRFAASVGDTVSQGEVIGSVGSTGYSTGPHLHFEVRVNGSPVDPLGYL